MTTDNPESSIDFERIKKILSTRLGRLFVAIASVAGMIVVLLVLFVILDLERFFNRFVEGVNTTLALYVFALAFGFLVGLVMAIARVYGGSILSRVATGYIEVIRGTPVVTQILLLAYLPDMLNIYLSDVGLPLIPLSWDLRYLMCAVCLGMNSSAYQAEFFRGSITSVSAGQMLAARAMGMSRIQGIRQIILPQSLRRVIPAWSNEASYLPKVTTAAYLVGVAEVFQWADSTVAQTFRTLPVYLLVAFFFIILITFITWALDAIYDEIKIPGL
ncbi:MAG: amino acid ABC transporter permease [Candidatus Thorarchaeota archaeon]|nr:amino acid ABC transporter permease [Candidatus Thorarchaeota archaeon]